MMKKIKSNYSLKISQFLSLLVLSVTFYGQVGTWTSHLPYKNGKKVCEAGNRIYCVSENSLFYFDKSDNSTNKVTKNEGLSDIEASSINYHEGLKKVVIGYKTGMVDVIDENDNIKSFNDIVRSSSVVGSKSINSINFLNNKAYLSTDFGVVVFDLEKLEIKESYRNIGPEGEEGVVKNVIFSKEKDSIYVHNEFGFCKASLGGANLLNYQNWNYLRDTLGALVKDFEFYDIIDTNLIAAKSKVGIFKFNKMKNVFEKTSLPIVDWSTIFSMRVCHNKIVCAYFSDIIFTDIKDGSYTFKSWQNIKRDAIIDNESTIWTAEDVNGLASNWQSESFKSFAPNGVMYSNTYRLYAKGKEVISVTGGNALTYTPLGISIYSDFLWNNVNRVANTKYDRFTDATDVLYDPLRDKYFISHFVSGVAVWDYKNNVFDKLTKADSSTVPFFTIAGQTRITSIAQDSQNRIWFTNHLTSAEPSIYRLNTDNSWSAFTLSATGGDLPVDLVIDDLDQKWITISNGNALVVFDDKTNKQRVLNNTPDNGDLPTQRINDVKKDRSGHIWVGTNKGAVVFSEPEKALNGTIYKASAPIVGQRPLLQDEQVLCIAIDGANRKWFGTANGAFLFNETGTEPIYTFNTENSLLPDNSIKNIAVNESTGEVFFATPKGIVSFWADATVPSQSYGDAKIFPNPVQADFDGVVAISGLKDQSIVKITDISGSLVYQQTSKGGTATWNAKTLTGEKVQAGVYLVYATDSEFSEQFIGKIIVVQ
jgi:hypothetical protein